MKIFSNLFSPIINFNINPSIPYQEKDNSISSSSKTSERQIKSPSPQVSKSPSPPSSESIKTPSPPPIIIQEHIKSPVIQEQISSPIIEQKQTQLPTNNDYDEDFSETSHSPSTTRNTKLQIDDIDIDSIQDDIDDKHKIRDTNQSSTSKSSADEQSEILVLVKVSANNTPRQQDDKILEEELPPPLPTPSLPISLPIKIELDDTSHDISEDGDQDNKIDKLAETFIRTFIDEAIDQGKEIENIKIKSIITKEASEWMSDEDLTDEENNKQSPTPHDEDVE